MNFDNFKDEYKKAPVEHYSNKVLKNPLVSVCVQTYQHVDYIEDCLEGILMQKTDFDYEILLGEDASTDGTREVCIKYAEKYPDKIRLFLHDRENNIEINGQPTGRFNSLYNTYLAKGKYIAKCEGDDYWTDPMKLQKQVDFLESHDCYSLLHTDYNYIDKIRGKSIENIFQYKDETHEEKNNCAPLILTDEYRIATCTTLLRTKLIHKIYQNYGDDFGKDFMMGDAQLWFHLARLGKVEYMDEATAAYRRHGGGVTSLHDFDERVKFIENVYWQKKIFSKKYGFEHKLPLIHYKFTKSLLILSLLLDQRNRVNKLFCKFANLSLTTMKDKLKIQSIIYLTKIPLLKSIILKLIKGQYTS